ncbi:hypothetical protein BDQ12DRAFT_740186 [Crucibulum laeve]|uniref:Uncharacterized protein n=1 Tax=Crucibulum laeve TaxID=68775 RepID=A0A5C3LEE4_9AGAR|nr:hypothetical protein BDQ12DRAFT_740186 [Crucibulum laeve]
MAQPQHDLPHYAQKLRLAINTIAAGVGNPGAIEAPYYAPWDIALNDLVCATMSCSVHPQPALRTMEDGTRIPDFAIILNLTQLPPQLTINSRMGFYYIMCIENKSIKQGEGRHHLHKYFNSDAAVTQVRNQAKYICRYTGQNTVVCIYAVGPYWRSTCLYKRCLPEIYHGPSESMAPDAIIWSDTYKLGTLDSDQAMQSLKMHAAHENQWPIGTAL